MEGQIKRVWLTPQDAGFYSLSIESANVDPEYRRVSATERVFPDRETKQPRHTVILKLLTEEDLLDIYYAIGAEAATWAWLQQSAVPKENL